MKHFDWQVGDFEPEESIEPKRPKGRRIVVTGIVALLVILAATLVWWRSSDARQVRAQVEKQELQELANSTAGHDATLPQVIGTDFRGNLATVEVVIPDAEIEAYSLRQTWFYRYDGNAWERVSPDLTLWGSQRDKQTQHFHFLYNDLDQETVDGLADDIETLYVDLLVGMGKTDIDPAREFTIEIVPDLFPARSTKRNWIRLASPHVQTLHPSLTDRDALSWDLAYKLSYELLRETAFMAGVTSPNTRFMLECILPPAIAQRWGAVQPRDEHDRQEYMQSLVSWFGWAEADMSDMGRWPSTGWRKPQHECSAFGDFIIDRFGYQGLGSLLQAAGQTYGWEQVVEKGIGLEYDQFMSEWRSFVEAEYAPDGTA